MIDIEYDHVEIRFIGIKDVEVNKYNNDKIFIKIHTNYYDNETCVILCCKEYKILYKSDGLEVKGYLNGME